MFDKKVSYNVDQRSDTTADEKARARENIGAIDKPSITNVYRSAGIEIAGGASSIQNFIPTDFVIPSGKVFNGFVKINMMLDNARFTTSFALKFGMTNFEFLNLPTSRFGTQNSATTYVLPINYFNSSDSNQSMALAIGGDLASQDTTFDIIGTLMEANNA